MDYIDQDIIEEEETQEEETTQEEPKILNREALLEEVKFTLPAVKSVAVEEWKGRVFVRELSMNLFAEMQNEISKTPASTATYAIAIIFCMCDEDGNQLLSMDDFDMLQNQSAKAVMKVFKAAASMNPLMGFEVTEDEKKD